MRKTIVYCNRYSYVFYRFLNTFQWEILLFSLDFFFRFLSQKLFCVERIKIKNVFKYALTSKNIMFDWVPLQDWYKLSFGSNNIQNNGLII